MAGGRVKAREGEIKRGGCVTCYSICYTELIVYRDWRRHLSKAVKLPMNYTALTPFSLAHSLPLSVHLTLAFYLPLLPFGSQLVCVTLSLVSPAVTCTCLRALSATWDVPERNEMHLSLFLHLCTLLPATCCFISHGVLKPVCFSSPASVLGHTTAPDELENKQAIH